MPTEYFERRERALLGDRFDALYAAPQETAARGVTVSALRAAPEQFAAQADFPVEPSPFCKAAFVVHQPDFKPGRHPYHHAGVFYSQEPSASSAAPLLGVQPGMRVLDLGCGSGILSIAALCLGAESAFACDIDEKCVDVAYENAALNGIGKDRYTVRWGDVLTDAALRQEMGTGYDIVVANIVADVIMGLSPHVRPFLKPGGLFLCSGIIDDRAAEVLEKLKADGWDVFEQRSSEGWFSYLCK